MGLLSQGELLLWSEICENKDNINKKAIIELESIIKRNEKIVKNVLNWGDELEFSMINFDKVSGNATIFVQADAIIEYLGIIEELNEAKNAFKSEWHSEFSNHMIESIPYTPYSFDNLPLTQLIGIISTRRFKLQWIMKPFSFVVSQTVYPRLGIASFYYPQDKVYLYEEELIWKNDLIDTIEKEKGSYIEFQSSFESRKDISSNISPTSRCRFASKFIHNDVVNPHRRFLTLVNNSCSRRNSTPVILSPLLDDIYTNSSAVSKDDFDFRDWTSSETVDDIISYKAKPKVINKINPVQNHIYMDSFAFGMSMSCIQATFETRTIEDARYLHDQLAVIAPLILALTSACATFRGFLTTNNNRWDVLEQAVDSRYSNEFFNHSYSRFTATPMYISNNDFLINNEAKLNNVPYTVNTDVLSKIEKINMDKQLTNFFSHIWSYDPLICYHNDSGEFLDLTWKYFESHYSTVWHSIRFKPPPYNELHPKETIDSCLIHDQIGWRVEFRSAELQMTDFENAAILGFIAVLVKTIFHFKIDLYIPISELHTNFKRTQFQGRLCDALFFYREKLNLSPNDKFDSKQVYECTLTEILLGKKGCFNGLVNMCKMYLFEMLQQNNISQENVDAFMLYSDLFIKRANGTLLTNSAYIRDFVVKHPMYEKDSFVSQKICNDIQAIFVLAGLGIKIPNAILSQSMIQKMPVIPIKETVVLPEFTNELNLLSVCTNQSPGSVGDSQNGKNDNVASENVHNHEPKHIFNFTVRDQIKVEYTSDLTNLIFKNPFQTMQSLSEKNDHY